jgi:hypothetical protein
VHPKDAAASKVLARRLPILKTIPEVKRLWNVKVIADETPLIKRINLNLNAKVKFLLTGFSALILWYKIVTRECSASTNRDGWSLCQLQSPLAQGQIAKNGQDDLCLSAHACQRSGESLVLRDFS